MNNRLVLASFTAVLALGFAGCGSDEEGAATSTQASSQAGTTTESAGADTSEPTGTTATTTNPDETQDSSAQGDGVDETVSSEGAGADGLTCDTALTPAEIDAIFGSSVEISGSGSFCNLLFADDAVGTLSVFSGSKADDAMDALLPPFVADHDSTGAGVLLDDDRGFVLDGSAVVRGDSGTVIRFDAPANVDVADLQAAMEQIAALLLTR